jgi:hypothetical protein
VKVLEKKRAYNFKQHLAMMNHDARIIRYKLAWYSVSLFMYGWFFSWIAYDIFVWHKPIIQVSLTNYVGIITAMGLLIAGAKLFFKSADAIFERPRNQKLTADEERSKPRRQGLKKTELPQPQMQLSKSFRAHPEPHNPVGRLKSPTLPAPTAMRVSGCHYHFGYLSEPRKSRDFPEECLVCGKLIECGRAIQRVG